MTRTGPMELEDAQKAALKLMYERDLEGEGEVPLREIEAETGCDGMAMGDLLHRGYVQPVFGVETWELTSIGKDFASNYIS